jgi:exonuclease III
MIRGVIVAFIILVNIHLGEAQIVIDGFFDEWSAVDRLDDRIGDDGNGVDILSVSLADDAERLYVLLDLDRELNYQQDGALAIYIDTDNNSSTGVSRGRLGYEVAYLLGDRRGVVSSSAGIDDVGFAGMGFVALPTVSSSTIEFSLLKSSVAGFASYQMGQEIAIQVYDDDGTDRWPDVTPHQYTMQDTPAYQNTNTLAAPAATDLRITSYNSLRNGLIESRGSRQAEYMRDLDPDVMIWQELYEANGTNMRAALTSVTQMWDETYVSTLSGIGLAIVSRYPIIDEVAVDGNAAYLLDLSTDTVLLINVHYPCCDNDFDRQAEVDRVMQFIREAREGRRSMDVPPLTPTIIMGDMNLVGSSRQYTSMITGDILINSNYGPDFAPDLDGSDMADALPKVLGSNLAYTWYSPDQSFSPGRLDLCLYTDSRLDLLNSFCYQPSVNQPSDHIPIVVDFAIKPVIVSTDEVAIEAELEIAPMPASEVLYLGEESHEYTSFTVFDLLGRRCMHVVSPGSTIDVSGLAPGTYVAFATTERATLSTRLVIM